MNETSISRSPILIVDDEQGILRCVSMALSGAGFRTLITLEDSRDVMPILADNKISVLILDLNMPHVEGMEILASVRREYPQIPVIILTAYNEVERAVECMKMGAYDYHVKPVDNTKLINTVRNAQKMSDLRSELDTMRHFMVRDDLENEDVFSRMVTVSNTMYGIFRYAEALAKNREPLLITGEPGVGREMLARVIHEVSDCGGQFVVADVRGMDDDEFCSSVFGYKKAAIAAAHEPSEGWISEGSGGTLLLKNIETLAPKTQEKILRLVDEKTYVPLGSSVALSSNARIIAVTTPKLLVALESGAFRRDLYNRLKDHSIEIPPLRERPEDIPFLLNHFAENICLQHGIEKPAFPAELITHLMKYSFPGNVPELQAMVHSAIEGNEDGVLALTAFSERLGIEPGSIGSSGGGTAPESLIRLFGHFPTVEESMDYLIDAALRVTDGNKKAAADILKITRQTINRRMRQKRAAEAENLPE